MTITMYTPMTVEQAQLCPCCPHLKACHGSVGCMIIMKSTKEACPCRIVSHPGNKIDWELVDRLNGVGEEVAKP